MSTIRVASILARPQKVATVLLGILVVSATVLLSSGVLHSSDNLNASYDRLAPVRYASQKILKHLHIAYSDELTVKWDGKVGDKVIVMAHTSQEDVSWVKEKLPDWKRALYNVDLARPHGESLVVPKNKGNEAMAYLTYIIDNYESLPNILLFLHAHRDGYRRAWHTDGPLHDSVLAVRALQLPFVEEQGYVNLRCTLHPGCVDDANTGSKVILTPEIWNGVFGNSSTPPNWMALQIQSREPIKKDPFKLSYNADHLVHQVPEIRVACCAQFAVAKSAVLQRSREDYLSFRQWLLDTDLTDFISGRVFEYLWHIIFGELGVHCPDLDFCYCAVYAMCK